jgi:hypothetical protein
MSSPTLKMLKRATRSQTLRLNTLGPVTTAMVMRCEGGVCKVSILLDMIFLKNLIRPTRAFHMIWNLHGLQTVRSLNSLCSFKFYIYSCLCELFDLSSKAGSLWGGNEGMSTMV